MRYYLAITSLSRPRVNKMAKYTATEIKNWDAMGCYIKCMPTWLPDRPLNYRTDSIWTRMKLAYNVLIGKVV